MDHHAGGKWFIHANKYWKTKKVKPETDLQIIFGLECKFDTKEVHGNKYDKSYTAATAWISNHIPSKVWDEITYPFPNFNGYTVEVWEWISNFIPHFIMDIITYPWWD